MKDLASFVFISILLLGVGFTLNRMAITQSALRAAAVKTCTAAPVTNVYTVYVIP